jgi:hypothetical protein
MTSGKLIVLRLYNLTFGRIAFCSRLLRAVLVWLLVTTKDDKERYVASSRYFGFDELE